MRRRSERGRVSGVVRVEAKSGTGVEMASSSC